MFLAAISSDTMMTANQKRYIELNIYIMTILSMALSWLQMSKPLRRFSYIWDNHDQCVKTLKESITSSRSFDI